MQQTLKQELARKPYAGLFIVYMMDRFERLSVEELGCWDECTAAENVYKAELMLLAHSNKQRFLRFILDYGIKRRDDRLRNEALKFIDRLRELPEFEPAIMAGDEETLDLPQ